MPIQRDAFSAPRWVLLIVMGWLFCLPGCAAFHPFKGVPVQALSEDQKGPSRGGKETIDLSQLRQQPKNEYLVDSGDTLGIYIENTFPRRAVDVPPAYFPQQLEVPPSLGYPVPIREDGTITLPILGKIHVAGLTVAQVEDKLRQLYVNKGDILKSTLNIMVSLQRARTYQVMVIRQESQTIQFVPTGMGGQVNPGFQKRGTGQVVNLVAGKNDVLHALAMTGGLPGLDAENVIYILRSTKPKRAVDPTSPSIPYQQPQPVLTGSLFGHSPLQTNIIRAQSPESSQQRMLRERYGYSPAVESTAPLKSDAFKDENLLPTGGTIPRENRSLNSYPGGLPPGTDIWGGPIDDPLRASPMIPNNPPGMDPALLQHPEWPMLQHPPASKAELMKYLSPETQVIRIPIRLLPDEELDFKEEDIILHDGDIVFIESRDTEIFYTGGLLGGGQYTLPRDYDMDVLAAVSVASGRQMSNVNGAGFGNRIGGISALNMDISVSASTVIVLRRTPDGGQIPIKINLYHAMKDPSQRVLIQPGDYVILRYTPIEAVAAFVERNLLAGSLIGLATAQAKGGTN
ncbi:MAG: polysaccharide biosynthesis/export family protein [Planctomycetales bacterium]